MLAGCAGLPDNLYPDTAPFSLLIYEDIANNQPEYLFAIRSRGRSSMPDQRHILSQSQEAGAVCLGDQYRLFALPGIVLPFKFLGAPQLLLP
jgi:hypothetical protein